MKIAIFGRTFKEDAAPFIREMFEELRSLNAEIHIFENYEQYLSKKKIVSFHAKTFSAEKPLEKVDFMFSVGGDGTFLESITHVRDSGIPILGINAGRLGFLATTPKQNIIEDIHHVFEQKFEIEQRSLIKFESDSDIFDGINFGLNEFSILKKDASSMVVVHAFVDGKFLNSYWADGLIVATPTGSTAYALSCGGPVIMPTSNSFVITPVSPHNLNVRPLVIADSSQLSFKIEGRSKNFLVSLDSRSRTISSNTTLSVRKEDFMINLVKFGSYDFLSTLRDKLNWGLDQRN